MGSAAWPSVFHSSWYGSREDEGASGGYGHYIINRENVPWLIEKSGLPFDYDMVVIDELSSFKNWQVKRFKVLMKVRPKVKRIVGLTGTPSSNGLMCCSANYLHLHSSH